MKPIVSVIMPIYNREKYLREALDSVRAQTYPYMELVAVDNGSTDGSVRILRDYGINYLEAPRGLNIGAVKNIGAGGARGSILCGCDSDDVMDPDYVERCMDLMCDRKVGLVWTSFRGWTSEWRPDVAKPFLFGRAYRCPGGQLGGALFRREAFDAVGGYDESLPFYEDLDFLFRVSKAGWRCKPVVDPIYFYRSHSDGRLSDGMLPGSLGELVLKRYWSVRLYHAAMRQLSRIAHPKRTWRNLCAKVA